MFRLQKSLFIILIFSFAYLMQFSFLQAASKEDIVYYLTPNTTELSYTLEDGTELLCQKRIDADPVCYLIDTKRRLTITSPKYWQILKKSLFDQQYKAEKEFAELKKEFRLVKNRIESDF